MLDFARGAADAVLLVCALEREQELVRGLGDCGELLLKGTGPDAEQSIVAYLIADELNPWAPSCAPFVGAF